VIALDDFLVAKRSLLVESSSEETSGASGSEELETKLDAHENALLVAQAGLSQLRSDIRAEEDELRKLRSRLDFIKADIQRNKDVKRLHDFGVETGLSLVQDRCPTCNQSIKDSLIPTESAVMGVEENIKFLKTELDAVKLLISSEEERLARLQGRKARESQIVTNLRATIRDLRSDLLGSRDFSVAAIREQVHLQEEITKLEHLRDDFEEQLGRLKDAAERWQENRARHSELPDDYFSEEDKGKLDALSECFAKNVQRFGYRSTGVGASASDNIRLIWAYTLALLQVSSSHGGKHWGVLLFDEPEQQKMKDASSDALYTEIAQMQREDSQVIIATSASVDVTSRRLDNLPHKLLEFGEKVIRPIQQ
jgi:predicted  nucleic acid-binding Zn-ribbon protein